MPMAWRERVHLAAGELSSRGRLDRGPMSSDVAGEETPRMGRQPNLAAMWTEMDGEEA